MTHTFQLKVTLRGSKPAIWRRVVVPGDLNLQHLHRVIQDAMGWEGSHLHSFEVAGVEFGAPASAASGFESEMKSENRYTLERLVGVKDRFTYTYDFGDHWLHQVVVEKVMPGESSAPSVVAGARACPPEDCGGVYGYAELVAALADTDHPRHAEMAEWVPPDWQPDQFDLAAADARVAKHGPRGGGRVRGASKKRPSRTWARVGS